MAARLGLGADIISAARQKLTAEVTETTELIRSLHQTQQELERLQAEVRGELDRLRAERVELHRDWVKDQQKKLAELERSLHAILGEYRQEMRQVLDAVHDHKLREKLEKAGTRQLGKVAAEFKEEFDTTVVQHLGEAARPPAKRVKPEELVPGARVKLR